MALLSFRELEQASGISRYTWRLWVQQGRLASYKLGRRVVVDERDYQTFLQASRRIGRAHSDPIPAPAPADESGGVDVYAR
jgi:hypothetical protein